MNSIDIYTSEQKNSKDGEQTILEQSGPKQRTLNSSFGVARPKQIERAMYQSWTLHFATTEQV